MIQIEDFLISRFNFCPHQFEIESREELNLKGVEQILLTADTGWFAGRAVALALVETEYFYWLDDDFDIHDNTVFAQAMDTMIHLVSNSMFW